ncbi:unnamed protein product [Cuscuta epithymum]|uniref:CCHC-type domain-containing protein n=1 Tax=Cuscuta epithymum TaxID=186058 RepID=A0AAV0FA78_9ASTE|nr:unnamed protein product [Cuscuta epithymum]CAH9132435.1 unnamed protein product [Cuscuta epithymum]
MDIGRVEKTSCERLAHGHSRGSSYLKSHIDFKAMVPQGKKGDPGKKDNGGKVKAGGKDKKKKGGMKTPSEGEEMDKTQWGCWTCGGDHFQRDCSRPLRLKPWLTKRPKIMWLIQYIVALYNY